MESKLQIKDFGPIKNVNLTLRNVNVFIGPQASGKSAIAKIFTIFKAPRKFFYKTQLNGEHNSFATSPTYAEIVEVFEEYNISSFLKKNTKIVFDSELHCISYENQTIQYTPKLFNLIVETEQLISNFDEHRLKISQNFSNLSEKFILFRIIAHKILTENQETGSNKYNTNPKMFFSHNISENIIVELLKAIKVIEQFLSDSTALYIPSERNFINIIKNSSLNLIKNKVPIPAHILSFGAELEKLQIDQIDLSFIKKGLTYQVVNGIDKIFINKKESILLTEAASGIQSVVPILSSIQSQLHKFNHRSFVIEEPEMNIFPTAQYALIKILESTRNDSNFEDFGTIHTYTTHSPYILSALNNLLYAFKVKQKLAIKQGKAEDGIAFYKQHNAIDIMVKKIVKTDINPTNFTAYQIKDGRAESIFNRKTGLIEDNYIDDSSDEINDDFEALMELAR